MPYVTQSDLEAAFGVDEIRKLADRDGDGVADAVVIERVIEDAHEVINAYLRSRYDVPLADPPGLIKKIARYLVRYELAEDYAVERIESDRDQAMIWLQEIREGRLDPGVTQSGSAPESSGGGPAFSRGSGGFSDAALSEYRRWGR